MRMTRTIRALTTSAALVLAVGGFATSPAFADGTPSGGHILLNAALKRIGQAVEEPQAHMDLIVAGNARTGLWKKMLGVAPAQQLVDLMVAVADDAGPAASSKSAARSP